MCREASVFFLVGLPDVAVKESQQRIESALHALNLHWPGKQVVINMAPADIRKSVEKPVSLTTPRQIKLTISGLC